MPQKALEFNITIVANMDRGPRRESGPVTFTPEKRTRHEVAKSRIVEAKIATKNGLKDSWAEANKSGRIQARRKTKRTSASST